MTLVNFEPLPKEEVIKAVERRSPSRIPLIRAHWWGEGLEEQYGDRLKALEVYPEDAEMLWIEPLDLDAIDIPWQSNRAGAHDSQCILPDWDRLDDLIALFPDTETDPQIDALKIQAGQARAEGRYVIFCFWRLFFERPWAIRGMTNLLMDYHLAPEKVHRLNDALCDYYLSILRKAVRVLAPDAFWTSDDLGHQTQLFMNPNTFRACLKPYYARIGKYLHQNNLHWWLHSCGNNTAVLGDLAESGVDVFHPVQKGTMDEAAVARDFGSRLTFLAGIDVQHILQECDPQGVRAEVRHLIDTFDRPDGGMCIAAGNGIVNGTPFENIQAFLEESLTYGQYHRRTVKIHPSG